MDTYSPKTCVRMHMTALFVKVKTRKNPKCPQIEWIRCDNFFKNWNIIYQWERTTTCNTTYNKYWAREFRHKRCVTAYRKFRNVKFTYNIKVSILVTLWIYSNWKRTDTNSRNTNNVLFLQQLLRYVAFMQIHQTIHEAIGMCTSVYIIFQ